MCKPQPIKRPNSCVASLMIRNSLRQTRRKKSDKDDVPRRILPEPQMRHSPTNEHQLADELVAEEELAPEHAESPRSASSDPGGCEPPAPPEEQVTEEQFCQQLCGGLACQCAIGSGLVWFAFDTAFCSQGACAKVSIAHPHARGHGSDSCVRVRVDRLPEPCAILRLHAAAQAPRSG